MTTPEYDRVRYALRVVMERALNANQASSTMDWAAATLRVVMRRHDVRHGVTPAGYSTTDSALLLEQFKQHPVAKEYNIGQGDEGVDGGPARNHLRIADNYPDG